MTVRLVLCSSQEAPPAREVLQPPWPNASFQEKSLLYASQHASVWRCQYGTDARHKVLKVTRADNDFARRERRALEYLHDHRHRHILSYRTHLRECAASFEPSLLGPVRASASSCLRFLAP